MAGNLIVRQLLTVASLMTLSLAHGQAADDMSRYDQASDLARLAELGNERMHYKLLRSGMQTPGVLWAGLTAEIDRLPESRYRELKSLVLESSVTSLQQSVATGDMSYEELTVFYLARIRKLENDPARYLNAVISLNHAAVNRARELDAERRANPDAPRDPVFGMPLLLKDNINVAGMPTTAGAVALQNNFAGNAFITERLLAKGAIILGKANLSEWAYFFCDDCPSGWSAMGGQTLNPYGRLQFGTGGSSSGSGASMAANYAALAIGSETSGSILSPSSANSLVGLKPTTGSLSRSGVVPISATLDTTGPMVRSVEDAVVLFNAMAGYDEEDTAMPLLSDDLQLVYRDEPLAGVRLGAPESFVDNELFTGALGVLSVDDASIVEITLPELDFDGFGTMLGREMVRDLALYLRNHASPMVMINSVDELQAFNQQRPDIRMPYGQAEVDRMAELDVSADDLEESRDNLQSTARAAMEALFATNGLDVMMTLNNRNAGFAALANYPALTVPMGYEENGRPVGLTFIAPPFQEQMLVDVGARFESLTRARRLPPGYD